MPHQLEDLISDSEDELPSGWEVRTTEDGKVYYVDHTSKLTQWDHPRSGKRKFLSSELPFGWERTEDEEGVLMFIDRVNNKSTYVDPRVAYAMTQERKGKIRFDASSTGMEVLRGKDLSSKTAFVTGGSSGIGFETCRALALHGCHVIMAVRDVNKGREKANKIKKEQSYVKTLDVIECDLSSLSSVKKCAAEYIEHGWALDMLILNAGMLGNNSYELTEDGVERTFQTNYLGHFYLTKLLADVLVASNPSRVVILSSEAHRFPNLEENPLDITRLPISRQEYWPVLAYNQSKLCCLIFAIELNKQMQPKGVTANAVHPGNLIHTSLSRSSFMYKFLSILTMPFSKSVEQGAATTVYCACAPELNKVGGFYFNNCCGCEPSEQSKGDQQAHALWTLSERLIAGIS